MELDDLKSAWAQYDKKLSDNLKLNEETVRRMNLSVSKSELNKPKKIELLNIILVPLYIIWALYWSFKLISFPEYCIPGLLSSILVGFSGYLSVLKLREFNNIDFSKDSVVSLQRKVSELNKCILSYRRYDLLLAVPFGIAFIPFMVRVFYNEDIYHDYIKFIIVAVFGLVFGYLVTFWINKNIYDRKFLHIQKLLEELERFENEEDV